MQPKTAALVNGRLSDITEINGGDILSKYKPESLQRKGLLVPYKKRAFLYPVIHSWVNWGYINYLCPPSFLTAGFVLTEFVEDNPLRWCMDFGRCFKRGLLAAFRLIKTELMGRVLPSSNYPAHKIRLYRIFGRFTVYSTLKLRI